MKKILLLIHVTLLSSLLPAQVVLSPVITGKVRLTDSVPCTPVKNQGDSPTCWVFGTNSLFESDLIKRNGSGIDLSEMFIARYAYIDKASRFLATKGKTYFEGGGQFHDVIRVVNKYGMVPEEVYTGMPGSSGHNHTRLDTAMKIFTYGLLKKGKTELSSDDLQQMNDTLDKYLGKIPASFSYRQKSYSPESFAEQVVKFGNDYAELVSFADQPCTNNSYWQINITGPMIASTISHLMICSCWLIPLLAMGGLSAGKAT